MPGSVSIGGGGRGAVLQLGPFDDAAAQLIAGVARHDGSPAEGLHVCTTCGSKLVQLLRWGENIGDTWWAVLRCPDCRSTRAGVFGETAIEAFDRELDRGDAVLHADLERLALMNMRDSVDRFVRALNADAIQPIDF